MMMGLGLIAFTACDSDRDDNPTLGEFNQPTSFVLNASPLADYSIDIFKDNSVNLSWSQPNYVTNTPVNYQVQVGLVDNSGDIKWDMDNGANKFLPTAFTSLTASISGEEISQSLNHIDGITDENNWVDMGYRKVAMRVYANIQTTTKKEVAGTGIFSNPVIFTSMRGDNSILGKGSIYVIGNCSGWTEPAKANAEALASWRIMETEIGSKIYEGEVDMPDYSGDALTFRFYTKLTGWDGGDSYGFKVEDEATVVEFDKDNVYTGAGMTGKGSWSFNNFPGGKLSISVDLNKNKVRFELLK